MGKNDLKTVPNDGNVEAFLNGLPDQSQRADANTLDRLMQDVTGQPPRMWGESIIGYGTYHYRYTSGREGDWMKIGFSPRREKLSIYLTDRTDDHADLLSQLGRHKTAVSCLYVKRLDDIDLQVLSEIIRESFAGRAMGQTD